MTQYSTIIIKQPQNSSIVICMTWLVHISSDVPLVETGEKFWFAFQSRRVLARCFRYINSFHSMDLVFQIFSISSHVLVKLSLCWNKCGKLPHANCGRMQLSMCAMVTLGVSVDHLLLKFYSFLMVFFFYCFPVFFFAPLLHFPLFCPILL